MNNNEKIKKLVTLAVLTAIALIVNIIESMVPLIPGTAFKIGFANIIVLIVFYIYGYKEGIVIGLLRVFIAGMLSPTGFGPTFMLSATGGLFSIITIALFKHIKIFSITAVSTISSFMHVVGQVIAATFLIPDAIFYAPIMLALSIPAGILTGILATRLLKISEPMFNKQKKVEEEDENKIKN